MTPCPRRLAPGLLLRDMEQRDLVRVSELEAELFGAEAWSPSLLAEEFDRTSGPYADRRYVVVEGALAAASAVSAAAAGWADGAAPAGVEILGYAGLWYGDGRGQSDLLTIATVPGARRHGIAGAMLRELTATASAAGCRAVLLEVRESNQGARRLYEAHGFSSIGRRRRYYSEPVEDAVVMRLELVGAGVPGPVGAPDCLR